MDLNHPMKARSACESCAMRSCDESRSCEAPASAPLRGTALLGAVGLCFGVPLTCAIGAMALGGTSRDGRSLAALIGLLLGLGLAAATASLWARWLDGKEAHQRGAEDSRG